MFSIWLTCKILTKIATSSLLLFTLPYIQSCDDRMTYSLCIQPTNPVVQKVIITCPTPDSNLIHRTRCAPWYYYHHKSYLPLARPDNEPQWSATLHISIAGCPWCHYTAAGFSPFRLALSALRPGLPPDWSQYHSGPIPGARRRHFLPASFISLFQNWLPCACDALNVITAFPHRQCFKITVHDDISSYSKFIFIPSIKQK